MSVTLTYPFDVTIPAGTPVANPLVTPTVFETNTVRRIEWRFPGGCNGQVGIQIGARTVPVLPSKVGQFFVRSGNVQGYDLEDMPNTGDWSVIGYNLGSFPHTIHVVFVVNRIELEAPEPYYLVTSAATALRGEY